MTNVTIDEALANVRTFLAEPWFSGLAAIATFIAVLIALTVLSFTRRQIGIDKRQTAIEKERDQALRVSAWIYRSEDAPIPQGDIDEAAREAHDSAAAGAMVVKLQNAFLAPVYNAVVMVVARQGKGPTSGEDTLAWGWPSEVVAVVPYGRHQLTMTKNLDAQGVSPGVDLAFTDTGGRHWVRRAFGDLAQLPTDPLSYFGIDEATAKWQAISEDNLPVTTG